MIDWLNDWLIEWLNDWMIDWLIDWMIKWMIEWMIKWLIDWMIDWFIYWLIYLFGKFRNQIENIPRKTISSETSQSAKAAVTGINISYWNEIWKIYTTTD